MTSDPILPRELIDHIIDHARDDRKTLMACSRIARSWLPRSQDHLFREIEIQYNTSTRSLLKFEELIVSNPRLATYVRDLHIKRAYSSDYDTIDPDAPEIIVYNYSYLTFSETLRVFRRLPRLYRVYMDAVFWGAESAFFSTANSSQIVQAYSLDRTPLTAKVICFRACTRLSPTVISNIIRLCPQLTSCEFYSTREEWSDHSTPPPANIPDPRDCVGEDVPPLQRLRFWVCDDISALTRLLGLYPAAFKNMTSLEVMRMSQANLQPLLDLIGSNLAEISIPAEYSNHPRTCIDLRRCTSLRSLRLIDEERGKSYARFISISCEVLATTSATLTHLTISSWTSTSEDHSDTISLGDWTSELLQCLARFHHLQSVWFSRKAGDDQYTVFETSHLGAPFEIQEMIRKSLGGVLGSILKV